ncbi:hypothetical protein G6016_01475 [Dietzia aerolata]|uniref:Uncharacterized protein n=1 Tax=Dietzia aerolata TaxID=595984 RepID=A0ABV5JP58_9ACTN|nr:hypothetical protein [Dietzia aerolata]MBB0967650.1 hypothetical protein [Dietzia aerolata]
MGSIATLAQGSAAFATNSGSTLVDFGTGLPPLMLQMVGGLLNAIADNITASVSNP